MLNKQKSYDSEILIIFVCVDQNKKPRSTCNLMNALVNLRRLSNHRIFSGVLE
jgi:hypothetical protein